MGLTRPRCANQFRSAKDCRDTTLFSSHSATPHFPITAQVMETLGAFFKGGGVSSIMVCADERGKPYLYEGVNPKTLTPTLTRVFAESPYRATPPSLIPTQVFHKMSLTGNSMED